MQILTELTSVVKLSEPLLRLELEETSCWSIDWANSELIAVGCTNGAFSASFSDRDAHNYLQETSPYMILGGLSNQSGVLVSIFHTRRIENDVFTSSHSSVIFPTHYLTIHQSAIRALAWIRTPSESGSGPLTAENPTVIASGGYDGVECLTDIRDPTGNTLNRTRGTHASFMKCLWLGSDLFSDVINSVTYAPFSGGPITIDHENTVKSYSAAPSMLGRGHTLLESGGPIWVR